VLLYLAHFLRNKVVDYYYVTFFFRILQWFCSISNRQSDPLRRSEELPRRVSDIQLLESKSLFWYLHWAWIFFAPCMSTTHKFVLLFRRPSRGFAKERVRRCFLISNVSAGKVALCRGQYIVREPRVYWARHMSIAVHEQ
jgi:hypothetical protein